ncbi:MAG: penicillin-binding protein 2 [Anaerolineae bacterium]
MYDFIPDDPKTQHWGQRPPPPPPPPPSPKPRLLVLRIVIIIVFVGLLAQLLKLQMFDSAIYRQRADVNRLRVRTVDAERGIFYDRNGKILVRNQPSFSVYITYADLPDDEDKQAAVLERLAQMLDLHSSGEPGGEARPAAAWIKTVAADVCRATSTYVPPGPTVAHGIKEYVAEACRAPYTKVRVKSQVPRDLALTIEQDRLNLPGVTIGVTPERQYLGGASVGQILGFMGNIPAEQSADFFKPGSDYESGDKIGLAGAEASFESALRGNKGRKTVEVDAAGREVGVIGEATPPSAGHNIVLTLDLELQKKVQEVLQKGLDQIRATRGVAIVMNPQTGEILAMVSIPGYDNNVFSDGINADNVKDYVRLSEDKSRPLMNRAYEAIYPTGSVFKIVPASAALQEGVIDINTRVHDPGTIYLPIKGDPTAKGTPFYCWKPQGHGDVNVISAIAQSCDVFFYEVTGGYEPTKFNGLGIDRFAKYARAFGFGQPTGIALPGEAKGLMAQDGDAWDRWKRLNYADVWYVGDTYNMAIGQGFFNATPLQMLNATAAVANGGTLYKPQIMYQEATADGQVVRAFQPEVIRKAPVSESNLAIVREGMRQATVPPLGTASGAGLPTEVTIGAKTGTAEFCLWDDATQQCLKDKDGHWPTHAWFTAFAPWDNPQIALLVMVDGSSVQGPPTVMQGSEAAAPIAAEILRAIFKLPAPEKPVIPKKAGD